MELFTDKSVPSKTNAKWTLTQQGLTIHNALNWHHAYNESKPVSHRDLSLFHAYCLSLTGRNVFLFRAYCLTFISQMDKTKFKLK